MEINSRRGNRERADLKKVIADELTISGSVERFFAEDKSTRLETTIPGKMKRDLKELTSCIDTPKDVPRSANRLIAEALQDLFIKYGNGEGEFKLNDEPVFRGSYNKQ